MCQTCEYLSMEFRCPIDPDAPVAWKPGDLNTFFLNITTLPELAKYEPHVLSRPDYIDGETYETADYKIGPWVVILDNFITDEEAERLIQLGAEKGYERSMDVGELKFDGTFDDVVDEGRTSLNAWCEDACYEDPLAKQVMARIEEITNIPETNSEHLQLLQYEVSQFYNQHHDYIEYDIDRQSGVRILTVFLYLNEVEAGGGTSFPFLNITVMPKKGRALIWPSVLDESPDHKDDRTEHEALPVEKGIKYGANAWLHQRDYKGVEPGCN
jgi:prolyl 4-hydroxylase